MDMMTDWTHRLPELQSMLVDHLLYLTLFPIVLATCISLPMGIFVRHNTLARTVALGACGVVQTIPSLAMLAFLLPFCGIGKASAITALTLYAMLPMLQNTITGFHELPSSVLEAADGMGFSGFQKLVWVEIPLALPFILGGLRTATTICVGVATLSTFIGAGGLGDLISRGLSLNRMPLILLGAGTAACLALILDFLLEWMGQELQGGKRHVNLRFRRYFGLFLCLVLVTSASWPMKYTDNSAAETSRTGTIRIGSKNFTEQLILGELLAQWIEKETSLQVERVFNLGGTVVCHNALINGEIDVYVEYSGTSLMTVLKEPLVPEMSRKQILNHIRTEYANRFQCAVLQPLGFENTYSLAVRKADSLSRNWKTISDVVSSGVNLRGGFTSEFMERMDGLPGLVETYDLEFTSKHDLGAEMMYQALADHQVDVISAFSTDGRLAEFDLIPLTDDRHFFPPYEAIPIVRQSLLDGFSDLKGSLLKLNAQISSQQMIKLNYEAQVLKREPASIVKNFINQLTTPKNQ